jgi:photosystem II stability/assembly factor-like uncharacterized protein
MRRLAAPVFALAWLAALATLNLLGPPTPAQPAPQAQPVAVDAKLFDALTARPIGPANMGGRIVDLAVVQDNPAHILVATASGGLWKTTDEGKTWTPIFDHQATISLGAIAVAPSNPDVIYVGTGESNARNSVSWGDGVYRSTDGGKTWKHLGLKETHHTGRIVVHPTNPDVAYVAVLGHLWGPNKERGLYKTTDDGKSWELSKFIDENTGFIDVAMDPKEPDILYAATYCVRRDAFSGGNPAVQTGPNTGLFKTVDGGKTWEKMGNGLPKRPLGRSGLAVYAKDPNIVYAVVQTDRTTVTVQGQAANLKTRVLLDDTGKKVTRPIDADDGGVFRSDDKGKTWKQVNSLVPRPFYYGQIRIDPTNDQRLYVLGVQFFTSQDGGKTFATTGKGAHPDHHALWINPKNPKQLVLGNDGGLYFSQNQGAGFTHINNAPWGQFYGIAADMRRPYWVYGGLQDNGSWGGPSATRNNVGITNANWVKINGADGFQCQADPNDWGTVYAEAQYGKPVRINMKAAMGGMGKGGGGKAIQPPSPKGGPAYRFNWNSPMLLSPHNSKTLFYGGNHLFRSDDRGDNWKAISPDLTHGKPGPSASTGHTLTSISESPIKAGVIYVGSDDGRVHVTRDGGKNWTDLTGNVPGLPKDFWVSRVECSYHAEGTAYLAVNRYRNDDRRPYVFITTNYGQTWLPIVGNLPEGGSVHVIRESSRNKDLLFVGTEFALFATLDGGGTWHRLKGGLPTAAMHDVVIHPRDRELVIGTHGRSIYVMDIAPLEELTAKTLAAPVHLFDLRPTVAFKVKQAEAAAPGKFVAPNPPYGAVVWYHLKAAPAQPATLTVFDAAGKQVARLPAAQKAGLHQAVWNLQADAQKDVLVPPGNYSVRLQVGDAMMMKMVRVLAEEGGVE